MHFAGLLRSLSLLILGATSGLQEIEEPSLSPELATLAEACAAGKIDAGFLASCRAVVREDVSGHVTNAQLPADFFTWLDETPRLRDDAILAMAEIGPKVASNLQLLRVLDERQTERYSRLAVARTPPPGQGGTTSRRGGTGSTPG